uniref:Uncharacterized protein n=1 Tax=Arundo donax TaxID=35708 RepID=A0A0A9ATW0_ARUDO
MFSNISAVPCYVLVPTWFSTGLLQNVSLAGDCRINQSYCEKSNLDYAE